MILYEIVIHSWGGIEETIHVGVDPILGRDPVGRACRAAVDDVMGHACTDASDAIQSVRFVGRLVLAAGEPSS